MARRPVPWPLLRLAARGWLAGAETAGARAGCALLCTDAVTAARAGGTPEAGAARTWAKDGAGGRRGFAGEAAERQGEPDAMFRAAPHSLATEEDPWPMLRPDAESSFLRRAVLFVGGYYTREGQRVRAARSLFRTMLAQAELQSLADAVGADLERFHERYMVMALHVWLLLRRLRKEGEEGKMLGQEMYDLFAHHVEKEVYNEGVQVRVSKWLAELEKLFYGSCVAYDKAMDDEDETAFARALARNVFGAEEEGGPGWGKSAAHLARYARYQLACLDATPSPSLLKGFVRFSPVS